MTTKKLFSFFLLMAVFPTYLLGQNILTDSLYRELKKTNDPKRTIDLMNSISSMEIRTNPKRADSLYKAVIKKSNEINYDKGLLESDDVLARMLLETGNLDSARNILKRSIEKGKGTSFHDVNAKLHVTQGNLFDMTGEIEKGLASYLEADAFFKKAGNIRGRGMAKMGIGNMYMESGRYKESAQEYRESYQFLKQSGDFYASWSINNLASAHSLAGMKDSAIYYFKLSLAEKERQGDNYGASYTYLDLGSLYLEKGNLPEAKANLLKALELKLSLPGISAETIGNTYLLLGKVDLKAGKSLEAYLNLRKAEEYINKSGALKNHLDVSLALAEALDQTGNYRMAIEYFRKSLGLKDSLAAQMNMESLNELAVKYETEQRDEKIKYLNTQNEINKLKAEREEESAKKKNQIIIAAGILIGLLLVLFFFIGRTAQLRKRNNDTLRKKNDEIAQQKMLVEEKNKEVMDSITYAKRIQQTLITSDKAMKELFQNHFTLFLPRDIVSGDFYWATKNENGTYLCVADCTGHGVPGAFMSLLNITFLNEAINEKNLDTPNKILDHVRSRIIQSLGKEEGSRDGMDAALIRISSKNNLVQFALANQTLLVETSGNWEEIKGDKMPVGKHTDEPAPFTLHERPKSNVSWIYAFSDGYGDQFGGKKEEGTGKKFKQKKLLEILKNHSHLTPLQQKNYLLSTHEKWKGDLEQVDDICVIGVQL